MQNEDLLRQSLKHVGITPSDEQIARLSRYYDLVTGAGFNLTSITAEDDFVVKHYEDSLFGESEIQKGAKVLDLGCGGGFPSVPLAIMRDDLTVVGLDATAKKATFVADAALLLGVYNLTAISGRAEECRDLFGTFDCVVARAVSALSILLELVAPILKVGGKFVAYKTDESELPSAKNALSVLNMRFVHSKVGALTNGERRAILVFEKTGTTPKQYPRQYSTIKKKPL